MSAASASVRLTAPAALLAAAVAAAAAMSVLGVAESALPTGIRSDAAPVVAALLTVLAAAGLHRSGSARTAWVLAAGAAAVLGSVRYVVPSDASADTLTAVGLVTSGTTGVLLGAVVAGAWMSAGGPAAALAGAWSSFLVAPAVAVQVPFEAMRWSVTQWLLAAALVAAVAAALTAPPGARAARADARLLAVTAVAACALPLGYRMLGDLVTDRVAADRAVLWLVVAGALAAAVIGAEIVGRLVPPGDARFVLAVTGALAATYPMILEVFGAEQWWLPLVVVGAGAAGVALAPYVPYPAAALAVALAVSTAAVLWPQFADGVPLGVRAVLVTAGTAVALAASLPGAAPVAALGLVLPGTMTAVIGAVWLVPADPRWSAVALAVTGAVCAWQIR